MAGHRASKKLSLVLRHRPELAGLKLQPGGWAPIPDVLRGLKAMGEPISREELERVVRDNDKQRFTIHEDGQRIRAAQGHSIEIGFDLRPQSPPDLLWHGTARTSLDAIFAQGLQPGRRTHVHLSTDPATAERVGGRHGRPVVLTVNAKAMSAAGAAFYQADNGVWLCEHVPPEHLGFA